MNVLRRSVWRAAAAVKPQQGRGGCTWACGGASAWARASTPSPLAATVPLMQVQSTVWRGIGGVGGFSYPAPRRLDELVKLSLLRQETPERCREIWETYHDDKEFNVAETWSVEDYRMLMDRGKECPLFVYPVHREGGFFVVVTQVQGRHILATYLEDFRKDPAAANPYLAITFYDDLADDKGLVLVRGDVTPGALTPDEAIGLLGKVRRYYVEDEAFDRVRGFTSGDFDFDAYLREG